jgi:hypothetical protein
MPERKINIRVRDQSMVYGIDIDSEKLLGRRFLSLFVDVGAIKHMTMMYELPLA